MTDVVVYTAIFKGRDSYRVPPALPYDFRIFTDDADLVDLEPRAIYVPQLVPKDATRGARLVKTLPHVFLPQYKTWVWYDSSLEIRPDADLAGMISCSGSLGVFQHPERHCVYDEAKSCVELGVDDGDVITAQMQKYIGTYKHPSGDGLASTCVLVRQATPDVIKFNAWWWREIALHSKRDQLSFNVVARRAGLRVVYLGTRHNNPWFEQVGHRTPG